MQERHGTADIRLIALAFILGYFRTFGIVLLIEKLKISQLKSVDRDAYRRRFPMPTDIIDGIDMLTKFRLMEAGIRDVQNLATANPVLVYVETPYRLPAILDWIAQVQLILAVRGEVAARPRPIGIRTIFDIPPLKVSETSRKMVLEQIQPVLAKEPTEEHFNAFYQTLTHDIHVRRLGNFWKLMESLVEESDGGTATDPKGRLPEARSESGQRSANDPQWPPNRGVNPALAQALQPVFLGGGHR